MTLGSGVQRQVEAFRAGFSQVFPYSALRTFTPQELVMLFGRAEEDWTIESKNTLAYALLEIANNFSCSSDGLDQGRSRFQHGQPKRAEFASDDE